MSSENTKWPLLCGILLVPLAYTYLVSKLSIGGPSTQRQNIEYHQQVGESLEATARHRAQPEELDASRQQRRPRRGSFPFLQLPPEICILIIEQCAEWPGTFSTLVRTSKRMQTLAYTSCLPLLPIRLIDENQVASFDYFLEHKPSLSGLVHHLWVTPLDERYVGVTTRIVKRCTNLRSLACTGRMLQEGVTSGFRGYKIHHSDCEQLTLLYTSEKDWNSLLRSPSVIKFFKQLTHLRLVGDTVPASVEFPALKQISYAFNRLTSFDLGTELLLNKTRFPSLHTVVIVREHTWGGTSFRIWKKPGTTAQDKVYAFEVSSYWTELELWCHNALGRGFWYLCAGAP